MGIVKVITIKQFRQMLELQIEAEQEIFKLRAGQKARASLMKTLSERKAA